ncbi:RNA recognition motif domain-containing protein [Coprobacter tertius]|uniref:RNA-binding protein n=1 Tax=Coprobacter tertius TaxID=2944915 RepID=A0ABT1MHS4_9BACT|nr:RNA-binding protein [Coprobacter tertius]MCP9612180.1 RNA-binding protein [Coprobacter tertius]
MNIYIGNLNYRVKEADLQQVMEEYGPVESVKIIKDRETGKSKGFAFIEMANEAQAKQAIEELNGAEYEGRTMIVKEARPKA